jgi:hypothetical protein
VKVEPETSIDELQLYDKADVAARSKRSVRSVQEDAADPACPLKWSHQTGRKKACDAPTLRAYLDWLRVPAGERRAAWSRS